jgi:hypothetical protein
MIFAPHNCHFRQGGKPLRYQAPLPILSTLDDGFLLGAGMTFLRLALARLRRSSQLMPLTASKFADVWLKYMRQLQHTVTYIRFEVPGSGQTEGVTNGIFKAAFELRDAPETPQWKSERIEALMDWFRKNLRRPDRFTSSKSKGAYRRNARGMSWFKDNAHDHLNRIREVQQLLADDGIVVLVRTTDRPGYIVYEDDFQVVAEPFRE